MHLISNCNSLLISFETKKRGDMVYNLDIATVMWHHIQPPNLAASNNENVFSS